MTLSMTGLNALGVYYVECRNSKCYVECHDSRIS
jgi:hypothetical protein